MFDSIIIVVARAVHQASAWCQNTHGLGTWELEWAGASNGRAENSPPQFLVGDFRSEVTEQTENIVLLSQENIVLMRMVTLGAVSI